MSLLASFHECVVRFTCAILWLSECIDILLGDGAGEAVLSVFIDTQQCHQTASNYAHSSSTSSHHTQGGSWKSASALLPPQGESVVDTLTWLKFLFVPALGLLLLAALLEEFCFAAYYQQHHPHQHRVATSSASSSSSSTTNAAPTTTSSTILSYLRQLYHRRPKLTTAYQNALNQNQKMLMHEKSGGEIITPYTGVCTCQHGNGNMLTSPGAHHQHASNAASLMNDASHLSAPLQKAFQMNFNGYNHLATVTDINALRSTNITKQANVANAIVEDNKKTLTNGKTTTTTTAKRKGSSNATNTATTPAVSTAIVASDSSSSSSSSSSPPPLSEYLPLVLRNDSTGFHCIYQLWKHMTFHEILCVYIDSYWKEEYTKYEGIEGFASIGGKDKKGEKVNETSETTVSSLPPLMLRYKGVRLSPALTPASILPSTIFDTSSSSSSQQHPIFEICIDYYQLFNRTRLESHANIQAANTSLHQLREKRSQLKTSITTLDVDLLTMTKSQTESADRLTTQQNDIKRLRRDYEKYQRDYKLIQTERIELESTIASSIGKIGQEKLKLEAEFVKIKEEHTKKDSEFIETKSKYTEGLEARHTASSELKSIMIAFEALQRKCNLLKISKNKHEKLCEKIKKLEGILGPESMNTSSNGSESKSSTSSGLSSLQRTKSSPFTSASSALNDDQHSVSSNTTSTTSSPVDSPRSSNALLLNSSSSSAASVVNSSLNALQRLKLRYDHLEQEHNILNVQLNELRIASYEAEDATKNEHYKLRYRIKLLEKDARDLSKWKSLAKSVEQDARESVKYKTALRLAKQREKILEKEIIQRGGGASIMNDPSSAQAIAMSQNSISSSSNGVFNEIWKARAKRVEREVKELRAWKKHMEENGGVMLSENSTSSNLLSSTIPSTSSLLVPLGVVEKSSLSPSSSSLLDSSSLLSSSSSLVAENHRSPNRTSTNFDTLFNAAAGDSVGSRHTDFAPSLIPHISNGSNSLVGSVVDHDAADEFDDGAHAWSYDDDSTISSQPVRTTSFDATLLDTHTPQMLPRSEYNIPQPSPIEVPAAVVSAIHASGITPGLHDHEPEFSHTLPAFLQTE